MKSLAHAIIAAHLLAGALLLSGCRTPLTEPLPLTDHQVQAFFKAAKDPRRFWITVYRSSKGPYFENVDRLHPEQGAKLDFISRGKSSAPIVNIDAGRDRQFATLIDTTCSRTWISMDVASAMRIVPLGPPAYRYWPKHVEDDVPGYACVATKLRFDQMNMETALLCARMAFGPLGPLARGIEKPRPVCVMGTDMLMAFSVVQLDYPDREFIVSSLPQYSPEPDALLAEVPFQLVRGAIAIKARIDGEEQTVLLDSAGDFGFVSKDGKFQEIRQISIGELVLRKITAEPSEDFELGYPEHPRIGRQLLSSYRITLLTGERKVLFERPREEE